MNAQEGPDRDAVDQLMRIAGPRERPPAGAYERIWPAAQATWRNKLRRRRMRRAGSWFVAAAAVLGAVFVLIGPRQPTGSVAAVARVDRTVGRVETRLAGADDWLPSGKSNGPALRAGTRLRTGSDGRAGLLVAEDVSLRIAESSMIELTGAREVHLLRGTLYVDTGPGGDGGRIRLVTAAGSAEDFGTQFELRYVDGELRLRVREGQVVIAHDADRLVANAGYQMSLDRKGEVDRRDFSRADPAWLWVESVAPAPPTDGLPVAGLLEWVSRETGRELRYADAAVEREAAGTVLHGRLSNLPPLETLEIMLATTNLAYEVGPDGSIGVRNRQE
jgi:ferric-dicitrate binding protein FerR (iron transport regulator)